MSRNGHPPRPTSITPPQILSLNHEERYRQLNPDTDDDNSHDSDDDYYRDLELDDDEEEEEEDEDNDEERNFSYRNYLDSVVPPPLPLIDIAPDESSNPPPNTINGCSLRSIEHIKGRDFEGDKLYDPLSSRYYADWLMFRETREKILKEQNDLKDDDLPSINIYKDTLFSARESSSTEPGNIGDENGSDPVPPADCCKFDAEFESGNLDSVSRIYGRDQYVQNKSNLSSSTEWRLPIEMGVDQEYDILLRNDLHTNGNIQWYYFSITTPSSLSLSSSANSIQYPLRVRLNIVNMMKSDALYNYGMRPVVYSEYLATNQKIGWRHWNTEQICYYPNINTYLHKKKKKIKRKNYYTLSFVYTFDRQDTVYFAHSIPYTYSNLQQYLYNLELKYSNFNSIFRRKLLCKSLCNNRCDLLTITSFTPGPTSTNTSSQRSLSPSCTTTKSIILITARVHPGETNSSHVMEYMINYLLSDEYEAVQLRNHFVFKIIPMLNPDGVIHGNYRCSLAGVDLNRKYLDPDTLGLYPIINSLRSLIHQLKSSRGISLYLDIHGHSQRKNVFFYGCDISKTNHKHIIQGLHKLSLHEYVDRSIFPRIFPKVVSKVSSCRSDQHHPPNGYFSIVDSSFKVQKSKSGTGRVVCWNQHSILSAYTIEISFCGNGNNEEINYFKLLTNYHQKKQRESMITSSSHPSNENNNLETDQIQPLPESYHKYFDDRYLQAELMISSLPSNENSKSRKNLIKSITELKQILSQYEENFHYSHRDYMFIAQDILKGIFSYSNLWKSDSLASCLIGDRNILFPNRSNKLQTSQRLLSQIRPSSACSNRSASNSPSLPLTRPGSSSPYNDSSDNLSISLFQTKPLTKNQIRIQELQAQSTKCNLPNWDLFEIKSLHELCQPIVFPSLITRDIISELIQKIQQLSRKSYEENILPNHRLFIELELRNSIRLKYHNSKDRGGGGGGGGGAGTAGTSAAALESNNLNDVKNISIYYRVHASDTYDDDMSFGNKMNFIIPNLKETMEEGQGEEGEGEEDEVESEDCGSDSDPSGDELPSNVLLHNQSFLHLMKENQPNIIQQIKSTMKSKKKRKKKKSDDTSTPKSTISCGCLMNSEQNHQKNLSHSRRNTAPHRQAITLANTLLTTNTNGVMSANSSPVVTARKATSQYKKSLRIKTFTIDSAVNHKLDTTDYPRRSSNLQYQLYTSDTSDSNSKSTGALDRYHEGKSQRPSSSYTSNHHHRSSSSATLLTHSDSNERRGRSASRQYEQVQDYHPHNLLENKKFISHTSIPLTVKDITLSKDYTSSAATPTALDSNKRTNSISMGMGMGSSSINTKPNVKEILTSYPHLKSQLANRSNSKPFTR